MDDPGPLRLATAELVSERIDEGVRRVARARVDDEPCGLVHDQHMLVLPSDRQLGALVRINTGSGSSANVTSSPPSRRWLFGRATPSTSAPASTARSPAAREPSASARNLSSRVPAAAAGTFTERRRRACGAAAGCTVGRDERGEQDHDTDDDEAVGQIEDPERPPVHVDEVGHVPDPHAVEEVRQAAADHKPERRREDGMARAERAKNASIHTIAAAVTTTTTEVAPENNPNAMPVFWT